MVTDVVDVDDGATALVGVAAPVDAVVTGVVAASGSLELAELGAVGVLGVGVGAPVAVDGAGMAVASGGLVVLVLGEAGVLGSVDEEAIVGLVTVELDTGFGDDADVLAPCAAPGVGRVVGVGSAVLVVLAGLVTDDAIEEVVAEGAEVGEAGSAVVVVVTMAATGAVTLERDELPAVVWALASSVLHINRRDNNRAHPSTSSDTVRLRRGRHFICALSQDTPHTTRSGAKKHPFLQSPSDSTRKRPKSKIAADQASFDADRDVQSPLDDLPARMAKGSRVASL